MSGGKPSQWFQAAQADLKRAQALLEQDPDLAAFLAWQAARKALKGLEKKACKNIGTTSLYKILLSFPEGQLAGKGVREAAKYLDLFKKLAQHSDVFNQGINLGPLTKSDARKVLEAARLILNFLEHRLI